MFQNGDYYEYFTRYEELLRCMFCTIESRKENGMEHINYLRELDEKCTENPGLLIYLDD